MARKTDPGIQVLPVCISSWAKPATEGEEPGQTFVDNLGAGMIPP